MPIQFFSFFKNLIRKRSDTEWSSKNEATRDQKKVLCYAPFNNMTINKEGRVNVCCYNTNYVLGFYPQQTINDIWFGEKRKLIARQFLNGDIPHSCLNCVNNGMNSSSPDTKIYNSKNTTNTDLEQYPYQIDFMLSHTCNLDCVMCSPNISTSSSNKNMLVNPDVNFDDSFIKQLKPFLENGRFFVFSGGEPFLIPIYEKIWETIRETNSDAIIYVQTNATLLNPKIKNLIENYHLEIGVSIDSVAKETYEKIRRNATFEKTFQNFDYFQEYSKRNNKNLSLTLVPSVLNAFEIPDVVDFCNNKNVYFVVSILDEPCELALWAWPSEKLEKLLGHLKNYTFTHVMTDNSYKRNMLVYRYFTELIQRYLKTKIEMENSRILFLQKILNKCKEKEASLKPNIFELIENSEPKLSEKEVIKNRVNNFLNRNFKMYEAVFQSPDLFYALFLKWDEDIILRYFLSHDDAHLDEFIRTRVGILNFLLYANSFDRITDFD